MASAPPGGPAVAGASVGGADRDGDGDGASDVEGRGAGGAGEGGGLGGLSVVLEVVGGARGVLALLHPPAATPPADGAVPPPPGPQFGAQGPEQPLPHWVSGAGGGGGAAGAGGWGGVGVNGGGGGGGGGARYSLLDPASFLAHQAALDRKLLQVIIIVLFIL
jgi:hypothetical protein